MAKLNQTFAKRVKPPKAGYKVHYDDGLPGFGLRVTSNDAKSFVLNYRVNGREHRYTIGQFGAWTAETARQEAQRLRVLVDRGEDPFVVAQKQEQEAAEEDARQRTMKQLSNYYLSNHAEVHKRARSISEDKAMLERNILPRLGQVRASKITRRDVSDLHASLKATPYLANRVLALLHKIFSVAADGTNEWGITQNPASGVTRFHEERRERWLSEDELQQLALALQEYPERCASEADVSEKQRKFLRAEALRAVNAIGLSMFTGCRKGEALTSKWSDFDFVRRVWTKPSHHTKQKRQEYVPLNDQAIALLENIPREGEYVFPGRTGEHLTDIKGPWAKVCTAAGLTGVRIHDLRHTFASHLVSSGVSLPILGKLLGHTQPQTTARYAHLADDPLRDATNRFPVVS
ncbi:MAG TPA: tyrosine-type recombinase/integrase [Candidatus Koribacter sp.]|jgi:integrase